MVWVYSFAALVALAAVIHGMVTHLRYGITERALEVRLFGVPLRRIQLEDIRFITTHRPGLCERWANTLAIRKRELFIQRRTGLFKNFLITPARRYEFKHELERAIEHFRRVPPER